MRVVLLLLVLVTGVKQSQLQLEVGLEFDNNYQHKIPEGHSNNNIVETVVKEGVLDDRKYNQNIENNDKSS